MIYSKHDIEMNFTIIDSNGNYVYEFNNERIMVNKSVNMALKFWYESAALELALEFQAMTGKWFGVEEL